MKNMPEICSVFLIFVLVGLGCSRFAIPRDVDLFEGDNAAKAIAKIKEKVGTDSIKVIEAEIHKNKITITIQDAGNSKNLDKYTFEKGAASGPEPVQAVSFGNLTMTADKYHLTDLSEINFAAIPDTVRKAIELSKLENAQVDVISMDQQHAELTNPKSKEDQKRAADDLDKQIKEKMEECSKQSTFPEKCFNELTALQKKKIDLRSVRGDARWDLAWRIFVDGPRGRKDFWADKQGNIIENPY